MINSTQIRERFKQYVGDKCYPNFVLNVPATADGTRLRFWMERAWEKFENENPDCTLEFSQIVEVFGDCPVYGTKIRRTKYLERVGTWITNTATLQQLEEKYGTKDGDDSPESSSVGFSRRDWFQFHAQICAGDKLCEFRSPPETWKKLEGRAGIALVREGKVIDFVVTSLN